MTPSSNFVTLVHDSQLIGTTLLLHVPCLGTRHRLCLSCSLCKHTGTHPVHNRWALSPLAFSVTPKLRVPCRPVAKRAPSKYIKASRCRSHSRSQTRCATTRPDQTPTDQTDHQPLAISQCTTHHYTTDARGRCKTQDASLPTTRYRRSHVCCVLVADHARFLLSPLEASQLLHVYTSSLCCYQFCAHRCPCFAAIDICAPSSIV